MFVLSVAAIWGHFDSDIGARFLRARVNLGHMESAMAIVRPDGTYRFYPWFGEYDAQAEDFEREREMHTNAIEVYIFISYRAHPTGWYGLATYYRPLFFHLNAWTTDGEKAELDEDLRTALHREMVAHVCALEYPGRACPYVEVLDDGILNSSEWGLPADRSYADTYSITHIRWQGWFHNLITILALLLMSFAIVRTMKAIREHRRWTEMIQRAVCPKCGYDLRLLPQPRCPECGTEFGC